MSHRHYSFDPVVEIVVPVREDSENKEQYKEKRTHDREEDIVLSLSAAGIAIGLLTGYLVRKRMKKGSS